MVLLSPIHGEDLVCWSDKFLGATVTAQTPLHLQRTSLVSDGHLIDPTMAGGATHALIHMNAVVEISLVREIVNPNPLDGLAAAKGNLQIASLQFSLHVLDRQSRRSAFVLTDLVRRSLPTGDGDVWSG